MAPEVAEHRPYNHKADVYSFGIIVWEMTAGKRPFDGYNRDLFFQKVVTGGDLPDMHYKWPREWKDLLASCWATKPEDRPNFKDIEVTIRQMQEKGKGGGSDLKPEKSVFGVLKDRHSMWF